MDTFEEKEHVKQSSDGSWIPKEPRFEVMEKSNFLSEPNNKDYLNLTDISKYH
jgi:AAA+ ATPase superfamily predicted ATPase